MPDETEIINDIVKRIDDAITRFNKSIPAIQRQILDEITLLTKSIDVRPDGTIKNTVANLRLIGKIKSKIENIVLSDEYLKEVKEFTKAFDEVAKLQNQYFKAIEAKFKPTALLKEIQAQSINATIESLTEAGIGANVTQQIRDLLRTNITTGGSYAQLQTQLRNSVLTNKTGAGTLERYVKQITTDALNQFSAQYSSAISDDLGLVWFWYTGSNIETTREFCEHLTKKKYIHKSELSAIIEGNIDGHKVKINPKTKLWYGAIAGTNVSNFKVNRGGYSCGHQLAPVLKTVVPANIRAKFEK